MGVDDKECIQPEEVSQLEVQTALIINEDDLPGGTFKEEESSMLLEPVSLMISKQLLYVSHSELELTM